MKKVCIVFLILVLGSSFAFPQARDTMQQKNIYIDRNFIDVLQLLHPGFYYSKDTSVFMANLDKYLLEEMYLSDKLLKDSMLLDSVSLANRDVFLGIAENMYWAYVAERNADNIDRNVTEQECLHYYEEHKDELTDPYTFDYWQAWIDDKEGVQKAKKELKDLASRSYDDNGPKPKFSGENFHINYENDRSSFVSRELYDELKKTNLYELSGPVKINESIIYIIPVRKEGGNILPFDKVKDVCKQKIIDRRYNEWQDKKKEEKEQMYHIIYSDDL